MTHCLICGKDIYTPDWYGQISRKYCPHCAAEVQRQTKAEWARQSRKLKREEKRQLRQLCEEQRNVIAALKEEIQRLRETVDKKSKT